MAHRQPQMTPSPKAKAKMASDTELNLEYAASIILRVFQRYDVDNGGTLQRRELRSLLRQCGATLSSRQCDEIIDQLDTDGDGEMNFAEFMSFLGRLYQLQFFGTDPGHFWNAQPQVSVRNPKNASGFSNSSVPPPPPQRPLPRTPPSGNKQTRSTNDRYGR